MGFSDLVLRWGELWRGLNLLPSSVMLAPLGALWMALSWFPRVLFSCVSMQSCAPVPAVGDDVETCSLPMDLWMVGALFFMPTCAII